MTKRIWLDCDPGHDDAFALLLACQTPSLAKLVGVSACHGNASLDRTIYNAGSVLTACGAHLHEGLARPVLVKGCARPLVVESCAAPDIHGESGIAGTDLLPEPAACFTQPLEFSAMLDERTYRFPTAEERAQGEKYSLCITGPATNIAHLTQIKPELFEHVDELLIMAGARTTGNKTSQAEFNVWADPHALQVLLDAPVWQGKVVLMPLELTHQVILSPSIEKQFSDVCLAQLRQSGKVDVSESKFAWMWVELGTFFGKAYRDVFGFPDGGPVHDPTTVAYALCPQMFEETNLYVEVDCREGPTRGRTIVDEWRQTGKTPNARICTKIDQQAFWKVVGESMQRANLVSPVNQL
ncbi:Uridine nucleosidase 1 [Savitreella phatthalungensis]